MKNTFLVLVPPAVVVFFFLVFFLVAVPSLPAVFVEETEFVVVVAEHLGKSLSTEASMEDSVEDWAMEDILADILFQWASKPLVDWCAQELMLPNLTTSNKRKKIINRWMHFRTNSSSSRIQAVVRKLDQHHIAKKKFSKGN